MAGGAKLGDERIAEILVEAMSCKDEEAAKRAGISTRTLRNYRRRVAEDPHLAALFRHKKKLVERDWRDAAVKTMRKGMAKLEELIDAAKPGEPGWIREVAGAVHIVGNLGIAREMIGGQPVPDDPPSPEHAEAARPTRAGEESATSGAESQSVH